MSKLNRPSCITAGCNAEVNRANSRCGEHARARKSALQRKRRQKSDPYPAGPLPAPIASSIADNLHRIMNLLNEFVISYELAREAHDPREMARSAWNFRQAAHYQVAKLLKEIEPWEELNREISN